MIKCLSGCSLKVCPWLVVVVVLSVWSQVADGSGYTSPLNSRQCLSVGLSCDFESECAWNWTSPRDGLAGFQIKSFDQIIQLAKTLPDHTFKGPSRGVDNGDRCLFLSLVPKTDYGNKEAQLYSPWYDQTVGESCRLESLVQIYNFKNVQIPLKVLIEYDNGKTTWVELSKQNETDSMLGGWGTHRVTLGRISSKFRVWIAVTLGIFRPSYLAIDNLRLVDCFTDLSSADGECCGIRCNTGNKCITSDHICDLTKDCPDGEDESNCGEMPEGSRCDFESHGNCSWHNVDTDHTDWRLHRGSFSEEGMGPFVDHTFGNTSGHYMLSELPNIGEIGDAGSLDSPMFEPPPCMHNNATSPWYKSCRIRFFYHKPGENHGSMFIEVLQAGNKEIRVEIEQISGRKGSDWIRYTATLPRIDYQYHIRIINFRGTTSKGNIAIDDFSMAPECFGIGIAQADLDKCPKPSTTTEAPTTTSTTIKPPGIMFWILTTCNNRGDKGPIGSQCDEEYRQQIPPAPVVRSSFSIQGYQTWKVPQDGFYTFIVKGASGGSGVQTQDLTTKGATVRGLLFLKKGSILHFLIGQEGLSACQKDSKGEYQEQCKNRSDPRDISDKMGKTGIEALERAKGSLPPGGGGGGGGATYIFTVEGAETIPIMVAGGGGGLGWKNTNPVTAMNHGRGVNSSDDSTGGILLSGEEEGAGPGGGVHGEQVDASQGFSLTKGGVGGRPCSVAWNTYGGFGGGGGACRAGGGGGGYSGGNSGSGADQHGEGGSSYVSGEFELVKPASNIGPGVVYIIRADGGQCNCDYLCAYLDEDFNETICLCGKNQQLSEDGYTCYNTDAVMYYYLVALSILSSFFVIAALIVAYFYRNKKGPRSQIVQEVMWSPGIGVNRLGNSTMGRMTDNPNYEFNTSSIKDLKTVPRCNLQLLKPLGQGAFGEVYKGYLCNYTDEDIKMPVAIKTLPEASTKESEMDFLMEAFIMYKFNHPNIVHFIGVSFEDLPRLIVLELLSGGDLKSFLREARPSPERESPLAMKDLLQCALDVAKGCEYLEEHHFIHRDIAARNCLLTSKGPGRAVKIADFGMARDIYRNDYYRKGGKAMLPVKWMPPEAFLDGIFTSKTDVWSFGVLLWEVMSLGYMPYPGRGNQEVMQLVTNGGRLEPPQNCPSQIYAIMTQCWHPGPEDRPTFTTILERLGYCIQDPDVIRAALPIFQRPPSSERDATVMRPVDGEACLAVMRRGVDDPQSPASTDYLIPMQSSYSLSTVRSDFNCPPALDSGPECFQMDHLIAEKALVPPPTWETSFSEPPPSSVAPRPPIPPKPESPARHPNLIQDEGDAPLLISPPTSPSPPPLPRHQDSRENLLRPNDADISVAPQPTNPPSTQLNGRPNERMRLNKNYHPNRYTNSGSSNNSSSSTGSSSTASSSTGSNSSSTASTLPLDPATLPCIPPPLQYVNVDVKKRPTDFTQEPYTIVETREHREISC